MRRKIEKDLLDWQQKPSKKPLVLFGARQVGKTTSVVQFGTTHYASVAHVDFVKAPSLKAAFTGDLDPQRIIRNLEALMRMDIVPGKTLLFLDEVQDCNQALTSLKYFSTHMPQLDVVAAGSLLGVHVARNQSFPVGYVEMLTLHPLDFEEYCWTIGEDRALSLVRESWETLTPCPVHEHMLDLYRDYLLVGGMPEVVAVHAKNKGLQRIRKLQSDIRIAYVADMAKYASNIDAVKIVAAWESMPTQLAKESGSTKFMWKHVASGANAQRYATAVDWLVGAGIVKKCTQISEGLSPLKSFENPESFKLYMADTGLLSCAYDAYLDDFSDKGPKTAHFRGGVAENYVMQQLVAAGMNPYYWGRQSTYEVEFVVHTKDGVIPIEVKSGRRVRSTSAKHFAEKYSCPYILLFSTKNFGQDGYVRSIPLYAAWLISS